MTDANQIDSAYFWLNEPSFVIKEKTLKITTSPQTDFWQRTHYGFERDNGHCLLTKVGYDFSLSVKTRFTAKTQYDQCGLIVRIDAENWIKTSTEYETAGHSRLGSVVTNLGYSDWAMIDINTPITEMWYRIQKNRNDYLIEYSYDGSAWKQLRITHLHREYDKLDAGIYACSPMDGSFDCEFSDYGLTKSSW
ncbi:MAG: DUF1349 domain-containing protein [Spirochaetales bacterium]|nr:DUF1349 domain-containing protein [Spirochaetales bacterium]